MDSYQNYQRLRHGSKSLILNQIEESPGIRYRELLRLTGLTNGGLEYHLKILEKSQQVRVDRHDGRRTRYYSLNISVEESNILGCVSLREVDTTLRNLQKIRRLVQFATNRVQSGVVLPIGPTHIVGKEHDDIGRLRCRNH